MEDKKTHGAITVRLFEVVGEQLRLQALPAHLPTVQHRRSVVHCTVRTSLEVALAPAGIAPAHDCMGHLFLSFFIIPYSVCSVNHFCRIMQRKKLYIYIYLLSILHKSKPSVYSDGSCDVKAVYAFQAFSVSYDMSYPHLWQKQ